VVGRQKEKRPPGRRSAGVSQSRRRRGEEIASRLIAGTREEVRSSEARISVTSDRLAGDLVDLGTVDAEIGKFLATVDFEEQRKLATSMQERFLELTPTIYSAFLQFIFVTTANVAGIVPNSSGQLFLGKAGFIE